MGSRISIQAISSLVPSTVPWGAVARLEASDASRRRKTGLEYVYRGVLGQYRRRIERSEEDVLAGWSEAASVLGIEGIPVEEALTLSEMAVVVSQTISDPRRPFTTIIFCHLINDEEFSVSAACRLQCEVSPKAFAFAVSQQQGASPVTALMLAQSLLEHEPDTDNVLVVAADKWFSPFSRRVGTWSIHGDAAAALCVTHGGGGHRLVGTGCRSTIPIEPEDAAADSTASNETLAEAAAQSMCDVASEAGVAMSEIQGIYLSSMNRVILQGVESRLGRKASGSGSSAYLGCSDSIVLLDHAVSEGKAGDLILLGAVGESGHAGCVLVERGEAA